MIRFIGLDVHKRVVQVVAIDRRGKILLRQRFGCSRAELETFARQHLTREDRVALEATTNTWGVVHVLNPFVREIVVSNPLKTKAIASAKIKTDKVDALVLAQLLRCDYLPRVWQPPAEVQEMRSITGRRASLVADRTAIKNRLHAVLHQRLIQPPIQDLFSPKGMTWLRNIELDSAGRQTLDSDLRLLEKLEEEVAALDLELARRGNNSDDVKLLITQPGVDVAVAQTLLAVLGDIHRFKNGDQAAAYVGLVPSTKQSADRCYHGPITKQGNGNARWLMIQAAQNVATHPGPLGAFFRRLAKRKSWNVAVVATARKLVVIAWHMLIKKEPYRYAVSDTVHRKLGRLHYRATGKRRAPLEPTGTSEKTAVRKGLRIIRRLTEVYEGAGLPGVAPLAPGEHKMLQEKGLADFASKLDTVQVKKRTPRSRKKLTTQTEAKVGGEKSSISA